MCNNLLLFALYSLVINVFFRPINSSFASIFGYITILLALLYPIVNSLHHGKVLMKKVVLIFFIIFMLSMIFSLNSFTLVNYDNQLISIISFLFLYWSLSFNKSEQLTGKKILCIQDICRVNYLLCFVLLLYGYGPFSFRYTVTNRWGNIIFTMGLGNPNSVSVYVMFAIMISLINIIVQKKIYMRIINVVIVVLLFWLLILLSSRTVVACVILLLLGYLIGRKKNLMRLFWGIIIFFPLIMIVITIGLGGRDISVLLLGKAVETGRSEMYSAFIADIKSNPLAFVFGQVFKYKFTNMHNAPLTIIANIGVLGLVVYLYFWYKELKTINERCNNLVQRIAFYSLLSFIIHSSTESLSMIGTIPYSVMVIIIYKIAIGDLVDKNVLQTESLCPVIEETLTNSEIENAN